MKDRLGGAQPGIKDGMLIWQPYTCGNHGSLDIAVVSETKL
jgi:hypothetical protein